MTPRFQLAYLFVFLYGNMYRKTIHSFIIYLFIFLALDNWTYRYSHLINRTQEKHNSTRCHGDSCAGKSLYCAGQRTWVQSLNPHENLDALVDICNLRTSILRCDVKPGKFCRHLLINYPGVHSTVTECDSNKGKRIELIAQCTLPSTCT